MPRTFDRLFLLRRRRPTRDESRGAQPALDGGALAHDDAEPGPPPVLLPAAIFRQVLYDPAEFTPVWLRPRPGPAPAPVKPARPTADETVAADVAVVADVADAPDAADAAPVVRPKPAKRPRQPKADGASSPARTRSKRVAKPSKDAGDR